MSKIANYLNANLAGETVSQEAVLNRFSQDNGILQIKPLLVSFAKSTDDLRKITSLSFQLAAKGRQLPVTVCGYQSSHTGASLTDSLLVNTSRYFNNIIDFDPEQALIHVQSGNDLRSINLLAKDHGQTLPFFLPNKPCTVGGLIGDNPIGFSSDPMLLTNMIEELEVVLADGSTLQAKALSKRELNAKFGLTTTEGEIYRKIDALLDDQQSIIDQINPEIIDNSGYAGIARVRSKNHFNLIPLLVGSQGTLGIIAEAILRLDDRQPVIAQLLSFCTLADVLDAVDQLIKFKPVVLNLFEQRLFDKLADQGKQIPEVTAAQQTLPESPRYHLLVGIKTKFKTKNKLVVNKLVKKVSTIAKITRGAASAANPELLELNNLIDNLNLSSTSANSIKVAHGASLPKIKWQSFADTVSKLETSLGMDLPIYGSFLTETINLQSSFDLLQISDKQKALKLLKAYTALIAELGGVTCAHEGEGRLKSLVGLSANISPELQALYNQIKQIFDPYQVFNPEVKLPIELRQLVTKIATQQPGGHLY